MNSPEVLILGLLTLAIAILLVVDARVQKIPLVRKLRDKFVAVGSLLLVVLGLAIVFRRKPSEIDPGGDPEPVDPPQFDDSPERITDAKADNTDLAARDTDRSIADLADSVDARDDKLDELRTRLDKL